MSQEQQGRMIRRVTNVDVIRSQPNQFALELTLDDTDTFVFTPSPEETTTVLRLFQRSGSVLFDQRTEEFTFEHYGAAGS